MARVAMSPAHSNYSTWSASGVILGVGKNCLRWSVTSCYSAIINIFLTAQCCTYWLNLI
jgi:hypothetical protein